MELGLTAKKALVTGSTGGIGFAAVRALTREGARANVNERTQGRIDAAVRPLRAELPSAAVEGWAADRAGTEDFARTIERFPEVDGLVDNLGAAVRVDGGVVRDRLTP